MKVREYRYTHFSILVNEPARVFVPQLSEAASHWEFIPQPVATAIDRAIADWTRRGYTWASLGDELDVEPDVEPDGEHEEGYSLLDELPAGWRERCART